MVVMIGVVVVAVAVVMVKVVFDVPGVEDHIGVTAAPTLPSSVPPWVPVVPPTPFAPFAPSTPSAPPRNRGGDDDAELSALETGASASIEVQEKNEGFGGL